MYKESTFLHFNLTRKAIKAFCLIIVTIGVSFSIISINHPIILKWVTGSARIIGRPIKGTIYSNGQINQKNKIFHVDSYWDGIVADYFILFLNEKEKNSRLKYVCVNRKENYVGTPSGINISDYDIIGGFLIQSETGAIFTPFQNNIKGFNFDPLLKTSNTELTFDLPSTFSGLKGEIIRIEL